MKSFALLLTVNFIFAIIYVAIGVEHLNELLKKGLLFEEDGRIHAKEKNFRNKKSLAKG